MCNRRDNAAGMMRRGLVTVVGFSPHLAEGKGLLLLSQNWIGLWERNMSVFREQRHGKKWAGTKVPVKKWSILSVKQPGCLVCLTATGYSKRYRNLGFWFINKIWHWFNLPEAAVFNFCICFWKTRRGKFSFQCLEKCRCWSSECRICSILPCKAQSKIKNWDACFARQINNRAVFSTSEWWSGLSFCNSNKKLQFPLIMGFWVEEPHSELLSVAHTSAQVVRSQCSRAWK